MGNINRLSRLLADYILNPDKYVYPFVIKEKNKKERTIITYNKFGDYGASLRRVHEQIAEEFKNNFSQRSLFSFAYHKGVRCYDALQSHLKSNCFIKLDIHHFFESIAEESFFAQYGEYFNDDWKNAIKGLFYKGALSIGFVTSPMLSDFYMKKFDLAISEYLAKHPLLHYSRYSDDILLSSEYEDDKELNKFYEFIKEQLAIYKLEINDKKTRKVKLDFKSHNSISYLGLNLSKENEVNNKITISKRYILFLLFLIAKQKSYEDHCYPLDNEIKSRVAYLAYNSEVSYKRFQKKYMNIYGEPYRFNPKELDKRSISRVSEEIPDFEQYSSQFEINIHKKVICPDGFIINDAIEIVKYLGKEESVEIPYFVDSIGQDAFAFNSNVKEVIFNDKLKVIGKKAFYGTGISKIKLPTYLRYIGEAAFAYTNIDYVELPPYIKSINSLTFKYCYYLDEVRFPEELEIIGDSAFEGCQLKEVTFPESVKEIGASAFTNNEKLAKTNLATSRVERIGSKAFAGCIRLKEAVLPDTVLKVERNAFSNCASLTKAVVSSSVLELADDAFTDCPRLEEIEISKDNKVYKNVKDNKSIIDYNDVLFYTLKDIVDKGVKQILSYPFKNKMLKSIDIPEGVETIGNNCFASCKWLQKINLPSSLTRLGDGAFSNCVSLREITLPEGITEIPNSLFVGCTNLKKVNVLGKITKIGNHAFENCSNLVFEIPGSVTKIGQYAFAHCTSFEDLYIPEKVKQIGKDAFLGLPKVLKSIKVAPLNMVYSSEDDCNALILVKKARLILGCENSAIPQGVRTIYKYAFAYCDSLKKVALPETVREVKEGAFIGCTSFKEVDLGIVNFIEKHAFKNCVSLSEAKLPTSLITLGEEAFANTAIKKVIFPESLLKMDSAVFKDCDNVEELYIPSTFKIKANILTSSCFSHLKKIEVAKDNSVYDSREGCSALIDSESNQMLLASANTIIPNSVEFISRSAFSGNELLEEIIIPHGVNFEVGAFARCTSLKKVIINSEMNSIPSSAFVGCSSLEEIELPAYLEYIEMFAFANCTSLKKISLPNTLKGISNCAFEGCSALEKIELPENVEKLGQNVFAFTTNLKIVTLPKNIKEIPYNAFANSGLQKVDVPESVEKIAVEAFLNCKDLEIVGIPNGVKSIGSSAFKNCAIRDIGLPESIEVIGASAFENCTNLHSVVSYARIDTVPNACFKNCTSLERISLPPELEKIADEAFYGCEFLRVPAFNEGLKYIGRAAFFNNKVINYVYLPSSLEQLSNGAFAGCDIENINVDKNNSVFSDEDSDIVTYLDPDGHKVLLLGCKNSRIPQGVEQIAKYAFFQVEKLKEINFPGSLAIISDSAFEGCTGLSELSFPHSLKYICESAFADCVNVKEITLNSGLEKILVNAFRGISVAKLSIPASVNEVAGLYEFTAKEIEVENGSKYFKSEYGYLMSLENKGILYTTNKALLPSEHTSIARGCYNARYFEKVVLKDSMLSLGDCFAYSTIDELYIGKNLFYISPEFAYNAKINKIFVDEDNLFFKTNKENTALFDIHGRELVYLADDANIPEGVTSIKASALTRDNIEHLFIPASLTDLSQLGMMEKENLVDVKISKDHPLYVEKDGIIFNPVNDALMFGLDASKIPNFVKRLAFPGFYNNQGVKEVFIPKNVTYIESRVFEMCFNIEKIEVEKGNPVFDSRDNCNAIIGTRSNKVALSCKNTKLPPDVVDNFDHNATLRYCPYFMNPTPGVRNTQTSFGSFDVDDSDLPF